MFGHQRFLVKHAAKIVGSRQPGPPTAADGEFGRERQLDSFEGKNMRDERREKWSAKARRRETSEPEKVDSKTGAISPLLDRNDAFDILVNSGSA